MKNILAIHAGHDASAAVYRDYDLVSAIQLERLTRQKSDGHRIPDEAIHSALQIASMRPQDVDVVCLTRGYFPARYIRQDVRRDPLGSLYRRITDVTYRVLGRYEKRRSLTAAQVRQGFANSVDAFLCDRFRADYCLRLDTHIYFANHHKAHAYAALFYAEADGVLAYTADGGGDDAFYSVSALENGTLTTLIGGESDLHRPQPVHSLGRAYSCVTSCLGFQRNRHEGKLTGLAAYGAARVFDELTHHFWVTADGEIASNFTTYADMEAYLSEICSALSKADAAASIQALLEALIIEAVEIHLKKTGLRNLAVAGGVFANVRLNKALADLCIVDTCFVFPAMSDEGLVNGAVLQYLRERDGDTVWIRQRRPLRDVYWGTDAGSFVHCLDNFDGIERISSEDAVKEAARLLAAGQFVGTFFGRMEFGPRALGARSILAAPMDRRVHDELNRRLDRTEFMPFAPAVERDNAETVFEIHNGSFYSSRFMTITCNVRAAWRHRIQAVVHVDGTARPQIVDPAIAPKFARILREFAALTEVPVLINTSFNVHEEPIVESPEACVRALREGRIDAVLTDRGLYKSQSENR